MLPFDNFRQLQCTVDGARNGNLLSPNMLSEIRAVDHS